MTSTPDPRVRAATPRAPASLLVLGCWALCGLAAAPTPAEAQQRAADAGSGWNDERTLRLLDRAVERRETRSARLSAAGPDSVAPVPGADSVPTDGVPDSLGPASTAGRPDSGLTSYQAGADGHVYFYLDRDDTDERTLVKGDQVALELYWRAPNHTKQRIVGLRDEDRLPNRMRYHLDHLTVVQNEFGDRIRMGDGDEVRAVAHPASPGADTVYDYRLADSLTLRLPDAPEPIRVYQIEVRPRSADRPAIIGDIFLDRATAEIVRMRFTFTPASYVDPRLDYIRVVLDNGLWDGKYWLPNEQRVEIRRQVPKLDFPAGGVIRAVFRIRDYRLNPPIPESYFRGESVVALPERLREAYPFETGIFDELEQEGLEESADLASLRERAAKLVGMRYLSGLPRLRFHLPDASSALRYNRAEGLFVGAGTAYAIGDGADVSGSAGYAFGPGQVFASTRLGLEPGAGSALRLELHRNALRDLGPRPGAAGALNTLFSAFAARDHLDPYFATGGRAAWRQRFDDDWRGRLTVSAERQRSAGMAAHTALIGSGRAFRRPVRAVDDGLLLRAGARVARTEAVDRVRDWSGAFTLEAGRLDADADPTAGAGGDDVAASHYLRPTLELSGRHGTADRRATVGLHGAAGALFGEPPAQRLFLLGGRATLPGYAYRGFVGDRFALARLDASHRLVGPWIRLRLRAAIGWTGLSDTSAAPADWDDPRTTGGLRTSVGAGFGLVYDILRLHAVRGLDGGDWRFILSIDPDLHDIL